MKPFFLILLFSILSGSLFAQESLNVKDISVSPVEERDYVLDTLPVSIGDEWRDSYSRVIENFLSATNRYESIGVSWVQSSQTLYVNVSQRKYFNRISWIVDEPEDRSGVEDRCFRGNEDLNLSQGRTNELTNCVLEQVRGRGYLDAQVLLIRDNNTLKIELIRGTQYTVSSIRFDGADSLREATLLVEISNKIGKPFKAFEVRQDTLEIKREYLERGYYLTQVFQPNVNVSPAKKTVSLSWKIEESIRTDIRVLGNFRGRKYIRELKDSEENLPEWFLDELVEDIRSDLVREGYLDAIVKKEERKINSKRRKVNIRVVRGPQYRLETPSWVGLNDQERIEKLYRKVPRLGRGRYFNEDEYREEFESEFFEELVRNGYLDVRVRSLEFSINRDTARVQPIIYMNEGEPVYIAKVAFEGMPQDFLRVSEFERLQSAMLPGNVYNPLQIEKLEDRLKERLKNEGYLDLEVELKSELTEAGHSFEFIFNSGPRYKVQKIIIAGIRKTKVKVIRREISIDNGDDYSQESINESVENILRLGIARSVDVQIYEKFADQGILYLIVNVQEAARFRFEVGPGFGSLEGLRAVFRGTYANIGGTGRRLNVFLRGSRKLESSSFPSSTDFIDRESEPFIQRRFSVEYFEPSLLDRPLDGRIVFTHRRQSRKQFDIMAHSVSFALDWRVNRHWTYTPEYTIEYSNPFNIAIIRDDTGNVLANDAADAPSNRLHSLKQTLSTTYLDDNFSPNRGIRSRLEFETFDTRLGGDLNFFVFQSKQELFHPLYEFYEVGRRPVGFGLSINSGFSKSYRGTEQVPVEKRFRLGGENTVRGYEEDGIEPEGRNGGRSVFYFRSEINFPIVGSVDLLTFFDGGNVYPTIEEFDPTKLRFGAGAGIRLNTPVGPLKFGYALVVEPREGEESGQIYFGIGAL